MNNPPTCTPSTYNSPLFVWKWTPDPYGQIDVDSVASEDQAFPPDSVLGINVYHANATLPGFTETNSVTGALEYTATPDPFGFRLGVPDFIMIDLKQPMPFIEHYGGAGQYQVMYVVPIQ